MKTQTTNSEVTQTQSEQTTVIEGSHSVGLVYPTKHLGDGLAERRQRDAASRSHKIWGASWHF